MNVTEKEQEPRQQLAHIQRDREWKALKIFIAISIPCSIALHFVTFAAIPQFGGQLGNSSASQQEELLELKIVEEPTEPKVEPINQLTDPSQTDIPQEAIAFAPIANLDNGSTIGQPDAANNSTDAAKGAGNFSPTDMENPVDSKTPAEAAKDIVKNPSSILSNSAPNPVKVAPDKPNLVQGKGSLGSLMPNGTGKNASGTGWGKTGSTTNTYGNGRSPNSSWGKIGAPLGLPTGNTNSTSTTNSSNNSATPSMPTNSVNNSSGNHKIRCQSCDKPEYPSNAKERGLEGEAKVAVDVDANGNVINVRLVNSSGHPELDEAAKQAARNWKFDPSQSGKEAIPAKINFQIENSDYARRNREEREAQQRRIEEQQVAPQQVENIVPTTTPTATTAPVPATAPVPTTTPTATTTQPTQATTTQPTQSATSNEALQSIPSPEPVIKPVADPDASKTSSPETPNPAVQTPIVNPPVLTRPVNN